MTNQQKSALIEHLALLMTNGADRALVEAWTQQLTTPEVDFVYDLLRKMDLMRYAAFVRKGEQTA